MLLIEADDVTTGSQWGGPCDRLTVGHVERLRKLYVGHGSRLRVLYLEKEDGMT